MPLKIQFIRSCRQCGDLLALRCDKCTKHPDRKARIIDVHNVPAIIETAACGCIKFACQRPGCPNTKWRTLKNAKYSRNQFCSKLCAAWFNGQKRSTRVMVACANPGCKKMLSRKLSEIKTYTASVCNQTCDSIRRMKLKHAEREFFASQQLLVCENPKHKGEITVHINTTGNAHQCIDNLSTGKRCNWIRKVAPYFPASRLNGIISTTAVEAA